MTASSLFLISAIVSLVGGSLSLVCKKNESTSKIIGCITGVCASSMALASGVLAIVGPTEFVEMPSAFSFANFTLLFNPLSGLLIAVISLLALVAWIYGVKYFDEYAGQGRGIVGFFMNMFVVSMLFVVVVDNVIWFLVFFELMSITSYFLVIIEQNEKSIRGGFLYLIMAHVGFVAIMIGFFIMAAHTGSLDFQSFREMEFAPAIAGLVFVLCFLGFGCKAGMVPFHSWLPQAHPAAPSNVSALMSGGMIKIGIFGIVKVGFDLLQSCQVEVWWGVLVLVFGAISSVIGVVYALAEHDIKRLLAYHSVENIGIILLGVGVGYIGAAINVPVLAALGLMAALYHLLNHAVFKGLLFLGAGSIMFKTHTRNMEKMGGLARKMPVTSACFLIAALAISAIPPLNGFVSEWYTYQSMFTLAIGGDPLLQIAAAFGIVSLAITGALAVTCFVKAYGVSFLSNPRSEAAEKATEVSTSMQFGMIILAVLCVVLGLGAFAIAPIMEGIATNILAGSMATQVVAGSVLVNPMLGSTVSTPLMAVLLVALIGLVVAVKGACSKGGSGVREESWACGYQHDAEMPVIATSFGSNVELFLKPLYDIRRSITKQSGKAVALFEGTVKGASKAEGFADKYIIDTIAAFTTWLSKISQKVENGDFRIYIVYIVAALIFFMALAVLV